MYKDTGVVYNYSMSTTATTKTHEIKSLTYNEYWKQWKCGCTCCDWKGSGRSRRTVEMRHSIHVKNEE